MWKGIDVGVVRASLPSAPSIPQSLKSGPLLQLACFGLEGLRYTRYVKRSTPDLGLGSNLDISKQLYWLITAEICGSLTGHNSWL